MSLSISHCVYQLRLRLRYGIQGASCCDTRIEIVARSLQTVACVIARGWCAGDKVQLTRTFSEWDPVATRRLLVQEHDFREKVYLRHFRVNGLALGQKRNCRPH